MRRVWRTPKPGNIARLALVEEAVGDLRPEQIRIKTAAVGLNFADIFALAGLYEAAPRLNLIAGLEFSGTVIEVGSAAGKFLEGDRVLGVTRFGGYASQLDIDPSYCQPLPEGWSFSQGAAYPVQTLTAWYALKALGAARPGQNILVQSAAGGVGLQALRICAKTGINVFGAVGNEEKKKFLGEQGFKNVVVRNESYPDNLCEMLGEEKLDIALDAIGGKVQKQCYKLLAPGGRLIVFGAAEFAPGVKRPRYVKMLLRYLCRPRYDPLTLISDNKSVMGFNLIWLWDKKKLLREATKELADYGLDPPHVGREYPFEEAPQAVEHLRSGKSVGKVVLLT